MKITQGQTQELSDQLKMIQFFTGHSPTITDTHGQELVADFGGELTLIKSLRRASVNKRESIIIASMNGVCKSNDNKVTKAKYGPLLDDGLHPSGTFRINNFFNSPEVHKIFQCKNLQSPGLWCRPNLDASSIMVNAKKSSRINISR